MAQHIHRLQTECFPWIKTGELTVIAVNKELNIQIIAILIPGYLHGGCFAARQVTGYQKWQDIKMLYFSLLAS